MIKHEFILSVLTILVTDTDSRVLGREGEGDVKCGVRVLLEPTLKKA